MRAPIVLALSLSLFACTDAAEEPDAGGAPPTGAVDAAAPPDGPAVKPAPDGHAHARCAWIEYGNANGYQTFADHASYFDAIHPDWYAIGSDGTSLRPLNGVDDSRVLTAARANHVLLIPMIAGVDNATYAETMYKSSTLRATHIANLVNLAVAKGYDGLDIDYEHLPSGDRAYFTRFIQELAAAMHAKGKSLSVAVYGESEDASVYDYVALVKAADQLHIMGYDYHWLGGPHVGPVSPLGWIDAVAQHAAATGYASRFILGIPNYGISAHGACRLGACPSRCTTSSYATSTTEMASCPNNWQGFTAGRSPNCTTSDGAQYFDDLASLEEKVASAKRNGLGGVTWWALGGEVSGIWEMVRRYY